MSRRIVRKLAIFSAVTLFAITFSFIAAHRAQGQARNTSQGSAESSSAPQPTSESANTERRPLFPGVVKAWRGPRNREERESRVLPMDSGNPFFQPVELFNTGINTGYYSVAVADVNGDGKPDLVVSGEVIVNGVEGDGSVDIFLGNGDGTFQAATSYDSGGTNAYSVAVADVNGDGKPDLVVVNECASGSSGVSCSVPGVIGVLLGNGDGTFRTARTFESGGDNWSHVMVADVNGDGKIDLLVRNFCGSSSTCRENGSAEGSVGVLFGNGDGTFQPAVTFDSGGDGPFTVSVADVNGDGKPDLLVGNCGADGCDWSNPGSVAVLLGSGHGSFQPPMIYPMVCGVTSVKAADVDLDGKLDLVVALYGNGSDTDLEGEVGVMLGNGDGTFQPIVTAGAGDAYTIAVALADVNGDGKLDAVVVNQCGSGAGCLVSTEATVGVLLNSTGVGESSTSTTLVSSANPSGFGEVVTFTSTVTAASGVPTGTVLFFDGSNQIGSMGLANRSAALSISPTLGSHPISAAYQGSRNFGPSSSATVNQVVNQASTTTALAPSKNPIPINRPVTYTATVTSQYGGVATGTVTFQDGGVTVATVRVSGNTAAYRTSYPVIGIHSITAAYSGDGNNVSSMSAVLKEEVGGPFASKTVLTTSGSPSKVGQPVTFTATVTPIYGAIPDGELVTFYDGSKVLGASDTASGVATFTTSSLTAKKHTIKATYPGDGVFKASKGTVTQVVNKSGAVGP